MPRVVPAVEIMMHVVTCSLSTRWPMATQPKTCLLYTSDAADERSSVDLGGRRIIKKKNRGDIGMEGKRSDRNKRCRTTWDIVQ